MIHEVKNYLCKCDFPTCLNAVLAQAATEQELYEGLTKNRWEIKQGETGPAKIYCQTHSSQRILIP